MTLSELRLEVQTLANDTSLSSTSIDLWINQAIKDIARRADWSWAIETKSTDTTTDGTAEITLPTDFRRMLSVRVGDSASATEPDATEYTYVDYKDKNIDSTGPYYYINHEAGTYGLIPTPATTGLPVFLKYYEIPATISNTSDTPPFNDIYHEAVLFYALSKYWEFADDFGKVNFYLTRFENIIEQMKNDLLSPATGALKRMKDIRELGGQESGLGQNAINLGL